ncbi:hypothetical protein DFP72DRAFT_616973 [Ephemerocybe angulata]|uniref:Uncharacterized protein n=1 Tax=Ephemerocybe angulata TaxID=980116 RepID=A0A8H6HIE6_9AGAR|nr:hypothetical protein DFP72DRAFT_616973 [Tulosesus angulatus]
MPLSQALGVLLIICVITRSGADEWLCVSDTGDRPYKCQYCGDQFARSDLLSRHVNKCHANEKPLVNTTTRRKGSASTSRATTSKQACDQCVQSSLPCDGSNPCAKCVQRKYRCTYVKFHRQTAPVGPGHNPRPAGALPPAPNVQVPSLLGPSGSSPTTTTSRYPLYADEYGGVLGGQPAGLGDELSQSSSSYGGGRQALHEALYPSQNGGGSSAAANTNYPFAPLYPTNGSAEGAAGDYAHAHSKYGSSRGLPAHDDMYRTSATTLAPTAAHATSGSSAAPTQWAGWPQQGAGGSQHHHQDAYHQQGQGHHAQHTHTLDRNVYGAAGQPAHTLPPPQHQQHGNTFVYYQ